MRLGLRTMPWLLVLLTWGASAPLAAAEPVRIDFYVTLTHTFGDLTPLAGRPLQAGDRFRGSLIYDPTAPPRVHEGYTEYSQFRGLDGTLVLRFDRDVHIPIDVIVVWSRTLPFQTDDGFLALGATESVPNFESVVSEIALVGRRDSLTLPQTASEFLQGYPSGRISAKAWQIGVAPPFDMGTQEFFGTVEPVPEPGTLLLLAGGGAALLARRRRALAARLR